MSFSAVARCNALSGSGRVMGRCARPAGRRARAYAERHLDRERILSAFEVRLVKRVSGVGPNRDRAQPGVAGRRRMARL